MDLCTDGAITAACLELGWGFWIKTGAFVLSAASFVVGAASLVVNSKHAKQRATVELMIKQRDDPEYHSSYLRILKIHKENPCSTEFPWLLAGPSPDREAFRKVLNEQEFIAVGIRERAFDEEIYKQMQYTAVVSLWSATEKMVHCLRKSRDNPNIYRDFERLAKKWKANPLRPIDD